MSLDLSPAPGAAPLARQVRAQASMEVRLLLRNGEQLLLAVVIPVLVLVGGVIGADRVGIDLAHRPVDVLTPGVLALAIMSTSFTSVAIATGFERRYGVLKRLGATPLPRLGLLAAKVCALLVVEVLQILVLSGVALALGWRRRRASSGRRVALACAARHGGVRLARAAAGRDAARRGDAGRGQPHLPAAARRRGRGPARARRTARSATSRQLAARRARWATRCATALIDGAIAWPSLLCLLGWAVVGAVLTVADVQVGVTVPALGASRVAAAAGVGDPGRQRRASSSPAARSG